MRSTEHLATGNRKNRQIVVPLVCAVLLVHCFAASAQQTPKVPRIGFLTSSALSSDPPRIDAFRQALRQLGYVEGKNILIEWRYAGGNRDQERAFAAELVSLNVNVIVTGGSSSTTFAQQATKTIPIVMTQHNDPVGTGLIASLARPGRNITGLSSLSPELMGKRLEVLKETVPTLSRVAVFATSTSVGNTQDVKALDLAAEALKLKLQYFGVSIPRDSENIFRAVVKERFGAILMNVSGAVATENQREIAALAIKNRLPVVYEIESWVQAGGLMCYGAHLADLARRAATYVDKILKGAKPSDLPVEQPTKFELVINLKTAKQIGLAIPPNVLARADRVIR
jgi:putative ABC transport system substrate-binding protein